MTMTQEQRWTALWKHLGARGDESVVYADLATRYSEPHRAYHTFEHIGHCLDEFEQARHLATNPDTVELALWYHDAIYDTKAKDSEERSAALAVEVVRSASLSDNLGQSVANLITATKHTAVPTDPDVQLLVDIDLSILGQSEDKFDEYEQQVRKEYEWAAEDAFVASFF
ncbi:MAG: N-methyl-D-aspartate receptor NMDAR2C subunit [Candidatus Sungbacteria bacterium]|uniref:N-methyl-D-aspartate receptor NMDAR2C subunit n=1 Tax=Candidatus Sungiibacteriota bacterium TaxID=2750080 RepID=A0A931YDL9_9BACT|nr:N-methyl-D-aspartate receptor NMDAR2C subunit [Candidatus Sungbacteria bacterium]